MKRSILLVACLIIGGCTPPNLQPVAHAHDAERAQIAALMRQSNQNNVDIDIIIKKHLPDLTRAMEDSFQKFYEVGEHNNQVMTDNMENMKTHLKFELRKAEAHINTQFDTVERKLSDVLTKYNEIIRVINDHMLQHESMQGEDGFTRL